jgi:adenosine deaminase
VTAVDESSAGLPIVADRLDGRELCDLHLHVGAAVGPHILWSIAHDHGFKLPVRNYWEFRDLVTADPRKVRSLDDYLTILHTYTEKIQSSPAAIERSVYEIIGKEYRGSRVTQIELRFNPMKRNLGGERDLDHIIHAAIRGLDRACLEYSCKGGIIFCLAREFETGLNEILVDKAIKYRARGVVGIDLAGTEQRAVEVGEEVQRYARLFERARIAGLGTTVHTGETPGTGAEGVKAVLRHLKPARIGHGVRSVDDPDALSMLRDAGTVLELCPTSNLRTRAVKDLIELREVVEKLHDAGVRYTINTDGTYMLGTDLRREYALCLEAGVLTEDEALRSIDTARAASFVR